MQLRQAEFVGAFDDNGVGGWDIDAGFDDGAAQQNIKTLVVEVEHHAFQITFRHLAMGDANVGLWHELLQLLQHAFHGAHVVVQKKYLPAAPDFALAGLAQKCIVPFEHEGFDGEPRLRRSTDERDIAYAGQRQVECARNRCGGKRQDIHLAAQFLEPLLLTHAEAVFLVDNHKSETLEVHVVL